jgi:glycosyltransferase involved in cell wall biosynthesis
MAFVSIIIPAYQSAGTIAEAVNSALAQTFNDIEIIVVDDGSTDSLSENLEQFAGKIIYLRQSNKGAAAARNEGIKYASGEIIAFLDADDIWLPEKLALQLPLFEKNPQVGAVFGNVFFLVRDRIQPKTYFDLYAPSRGDIFLSLFTRNFIPMPSVLVRRKALEQAGLFDESCHAEDYKLWLQIANFWQFDYCGDPVAIYRVSPQQVSRSYTKVAVSLLQVKKEIYQTYPGRFDGADWEVLERGIYNKYLYLALCYMRDAKKEEAARTLDQYKQARGLSMVYVIFRLVLNLPKFLMLVVIGAWDKFYKKAGLGYV